MPLLLALSIGCAGDQPEEHVYSNRVVLFIWPDSLELAEHKQQMGEQDFYVAADDENWYRAVAFEMLDSLGVNRQTVEGKEFTFLVDGRERTYDWSGAESLWFVVVYDGKREPIVTHSVNLVDHVDYLTH